MAIKAADVAKLRKMTGAGMMDCKKALAETNGDFDEAIDLLRKKGQKIANKRADREATEGAVLAKASSDNKYAAILVLNCETDFVAKNEDFVGFAQKILDLAVENKAESMDAVNGLMIDNKPVSEVITNQVGVVGEKLDFSYFETLTSEDVATYIHPGNKLASIAGFNKAVNSDIKKDIVMQIAAMAPVSIDTSDVPQSVIDKEIEIGTEQAIQEGKPADLAEKIAKGKLNKFFKESTLLNQQFVKDSKTTIGDHLKKADKNLSVTVFKRFTLNA